MIKIPLLDDVLKGLPDNARLRSQLGAYVQKIEELEAEVASLKDDKRELEAKNQKLQRRLAEHEPNDSPDHEDTLLLKLIADCGPMSVAMFEATLPEVQQPLHPEVVKLKLTELSKAGYVRGDETTEYGEQAYRLCDKARRYLIEKRLLGPSRQ